MKIAEWGILPKILVLFTIILLAFSYYDHSQSVYQDLEFRQVVRAFDDQIAFGRENDAVGTLRQLLSLELSSFQYLQVLKRAGALAVSGSGESLFVEFARRAAERFPGREELWFIYCRALILNGNAERAADVAKKKLKSNRYLGMRAESLLSAGKEIDASIKELAAESPFSSGGLINVLNSRDPRQFQTVGQEWDSPELIADAALLYAEVGSIKEGNELLKNSRENMFPELSLHLAYDAMDPQYGIVLVQEMLEEQDDDISGLKLYQADFAFDMGRINSALEIYQDIMQKDPAYSVLPYINAAVLDPAMAETYLLQGFDYFPRTELLLERLGEFYYRNGDTASARDIFNQLMEIHPGHPSAEIRLADMELGAGSQGSIARLWETYHEEKGDAIALYLAWRLFGNRDQDGLRILLDLQEQRNGPDQDLLEGLYLTLVGDLEKAAGKFEAANERSPRWEYLYNAGRLYLEAGNAETALKLFSKADDFFTLGNDLTDENRSLIWLGIGESYFGMEDRKNAAVALKYALDLDPANLRASLLTNSLGIVK